MHRDSRSKADPPSAPVQPVLYQPPFFAPEAFREIHVWDLVQIILTRWRAGAAVFAAVLILGILYSLTRTPLYRSTSRILFERASVNLTDVKGVYEDDQPVGRNDDTIPTQVKLVNSRPIMEDVLRRLDLVETPPFRDSNDPAGLLAEMVEAQPIRNSRLVDVHVERPDPKEASRIVNATVDAFIEKTRQRRLGVSEGGLESLRAKAEELRIRLEAADQRLLAFMAEHDIQVGFEETRRIEMDELRALNENLWRTKPLRLGLQARLQAAREAMLRGDAIDTLPFVIETPIVSQLTVQLAQLGVEYEEMRERFGQKHPQLQSIERQREALKTQLSLFAYAAISSTREQFDQANNEESLLLEAIHEQERKVRALSEIESAFNLLAQDRASIQGAYAQILGRIEEVDINQLGGQGENVFVIFRGSVPQKKSSPRHLLNFAVALMLGGVVGVGSCFFIDYMDTSIRSAEAAEEIFDAKVLGVIPPIPQGGTERDSRDFIISQDALSPLAESFRLIRSALVETSGQSPLRHILVTSSAPLEGKSLASINLALMYAQAAKRTVLVDADMRKPRLHSSFGAENKTGLSTLLRSEDVRADLPHALVKTEYQNLHLLPSGPRSHHAAELLESAVFPELLRELESQFDLIILDSPPGAQLADVQVMSRHVDGIVIVVRLLRARTGPSRYFATGLHSAGASVAGLICNYADIPRNRFLSSYYGYYGYYGDYGYYQDDESPPARGSREG
jgi:capsular exopolysaccharide synthesis family protein